jgi:hypothetical protein
MKAVMNEAGAPAKKNIVAKGKYFAVSSSHADKQEFDQ